MRYLGNLLENNERELIENSEKALTLQSQNAAIPSVEGLSIATTL